MCMCIHLCVSGTIHMHGSQIITVCIKSVLLVLFTTSLLGMELRSQTQQQAFYLLIYLASPRLCFPTVISHVKYYFFPFLRPSLPIA